MWIGTTTVILIELKNIFNTFLKRFFVLALIILVFQQTTTITKKENNGFDKKKSFKYVSQFI